MDREYELGDRMVWFRQDQPEFSDWMTFGPPPTGEVYEYCHASCHSCGARLCVRIDFEPLVPRRVAEILLEEDWPRDPRQPNVVFPPVMY